MHNMSFLKYSGIVAAILAWLIIVASVSINPWFVFTKNAFSDLGGPVATDPWLYNYGLIAVAIFTFMYGAYLAAINEEKIEVIGSSFVMVASIFLALIGIFHEGTYPHVFVSTWFFVQFDIAILIYGIGLLTRMKKLGISMILLFLVATLLAILVPWPSAATVEAWGISAIDVWVIISYMSQKKISEGKIKN